MKYCLGLKLCTLHILGQAKMPDWHSCVSTINFSHPAFSQPLFLTLIPGRLGASIMCLMMGSGSFATLVCLTPVCCLPRVGGDSIVSGGHAQWSVSDGLS